jgi:hypothetical protein
MQNQRSRRRKPKDWRRAVITLMFGLLAAILLWVIVLWAALEIE